MSYTLILDLFLASRTGRNKGVLCPPRCGLLLQQPKPTCQVCLHLLTPLNQSGATPGAGPQQVLATLCHQCPLEREPFILLPGMHLALGSSGRLDHPQTKLSISSWQSWEAKPRLRSSAPPQENTPLSENPFSLLPSRQGYLLKYVPSK